jgi:FtsP/CotA-like multicopper oxidase with cupredoxin domain
MNVYKKSCQMLFKWQFFFALILFGAIVPSHPAPIILQVKNREITVNGKSAQMYEISQPNGMQGLAMQKGDLFDVIVENQIDQPTGIHWHGLLLPNDKDGVPYVTQFPIPPGGRYAYRFPLIQSGTFWMHAHYGLQEQKLLAAPLILHDPNVKNTSQQEVVMFLSDFTFRDPLEIFNELRNGGSKEMKEMSSSVNSDRKMAMNVDLNDVKYDAFLTNWRTLSNPEVVAIVPLKEIRLRVINGSSSTNFFILLGKLKGEVIATDGSDCIPLIDSQFELAVAQRLDIRIKIPSGENAYPILAQVEGSDMQTGLILATVGAQIPSIKERAEKPMEAISYRQELLLRGKYPLPKKETNRRLIVNLDGNMDKYIWTINGKAYPNYEPLIVKQGERVELVFINRSFMSHPMHLHGHVFQVTEINNQPLEGALRDTLLVLPKSTAKVQFDANSPGNWPFHCHNLYHQYGGMLTTLNYAGFNGPVFRKNHTVEISDGQMRETETTDREKKL